MFWIGVRSYSRLELEPACFVLWQGVRVSTCWNPVWESWVIGDNGPGSKSVTEKYLHLTWKCLCLDLTCMRYRKGSGLHHHHGQQHQTESCHQTCRDLEIRTKVQSYLFNFIKLWIYKYTLIYRPIIVKRILLAYFPIGNFSHKQINKFNKNI